MKGSCQAFQDKEGLTEGLYRRPVTAFTPNFDSKSKSVRGAGAPSPPSEEGGGCLHKGFEQADGGRDTPSMCENSRYSRQQRQMTAFSFGARLHLGANSRLAVSLPQSRCFNPFSPRQLPPQREPRRLPPQATELQRRVPRLSPPLAGCPHPSRCSAARSTAPPSPRGRRCAPAPRTEFALCGGRERRFALNMPRSAEKARSFAEKFFILRGFGRRRLDYYGEQQYN